MVITRTPFRISFFGGGTDYPIWYRKNRGAVIGTSINKFCYVTCRILPPFFKYNYRIRYTKQEYTKKISQIKHPSVRECLNFLKINSSLEIQHNADLPAFTGLGTSSAFTVGLLNSLYGLFGNRVDKKKLAKDAIHIEQNMIKENVGSQDQTLASYGGFNKILFGGKDEIKIMPINIGKKRLNYLQNHLMLFFTGITRQASGIAGTQIKSTPKKSKELKAMLQIVDKAYKILTSKDTKLDQFGKLLNENWKIKRSLTHKITNETIDLIYNSALSAGAIGGKLLGAGGGGFMLFYVKPDSHETIRKKLKKLLYVPFSFEYQGSKIIYRMPET